VRGHAAGRRPLADSGVATPAKIEEEPMPTPLEHQYPYILPALERVAP